MPLLCAVVWSSEQMFSQRDVRGEVGKLTLPRQLKQRPSTHPCSLCVSPK